MSGSSAQLYEEDFVRWTEEQAAVLREAAKLGTNLPLDWENLAEEIDSLGRSQRHELRSRIATIIEHLIKLRQSLATDARSGWMDTIDRERDDIELLLRDSPSLRPEVARVIAEEGPRALRRAHRSLLRHDELASAAAALSVGADFTEQQVLGDWFPGAPPQPGPVPPVTSGAEKGR
jgi:hypothetical protein